jgi:hypothetical protein
MKAPMMTIPGDSRWWKERTSTIDARREVDCHTETAGWPRRNVMLNFALDLRFPIGPSPHWCENDFGNEMGRD